MTSEISWFSALCDDDYEFLGQPDPMHASSWEHCRNIVMAAEKGVHCVMPKSMWVKR